jgi:hypothetical protein
VWERGHLAALLECSSRTTQQRWYWHKQELHLRTKKEAEVCCFFRSIRFSCLSTTNTTPNSDALPHMAELCVLPLKLTLT